MFVSFVTAALAFSGAPAPTRTSRSVVHMSEVSNTRREVLTRGVAAFGGLVAAASQAEAKAGEGAKYSVFGMSFGKGPDDVSFSEPFEYLDTKIGKQGATLADSEKYASFAKLVADGEKRLATEVPAYIKKESWALGRGQMRSMMYSIRQGMLQANSGIADKDKAAKAAKLYKKFVRDLETLDFAMQEKEKEKALDASKVAQESLTAWKSFVN